MVNSPFYFTWAKQQESNNIEIKSVGDHFFILNSGEIIYDLSSVSFHASFGMKNNYLIDKVNYQLKHMPIAGPKFTFPEKTNTAQELIDYINLGSGKIFFTTSGSEAVENALKMARQIKQKKIILARKKSYHGATLGSLSVTGDWRNDHHFTTDDWVLRIPEPHEDPNLAETRKVIETAGAKNIAGIILETITGANGVIIPSSEWWKGIQSLCKEFDLFLILDEVICGFNRTGKPFGFSHYNISPDFVCMAKSLTGGIVPMGALWTSEKVSKYYDQNILSCGLTNYAHPLGLAAVTGVIQLLNQEELKSQIKNNEEVLNSFCHKVSSSSCVKEIRSIGLLAAIELDYLPNANFLLENGLSCITRENMIILAPAFNFPTHLLEEILEKLFNIIISKASS